MHTEFFTDAHFERTRNEVWLWVIAAILFTIHLLPACYALNISNRLSSRQLSPLLPTETGFHTVHSLVSNLLCSQKWPWISNPSVSTCWVLGLQTCTTRQVSLASHLLEIIYNYYSNFIGKDAYSIVLCISLQATAHREASYIFH